MGLLAILLPALLLGDPLPRLALEPLDAAAATIPARGRVAVIDLFATWCGPCRDAVAPLERLRLRYRGRVDFLSVDEDEAPEVVRGWARSVGAAAPIAIDRGRRAYAALGAHRLPTTVIVDGRGVVRRMNHGFGRGYEARLAAWIDALLAEEAAAR